MNCPTCTQTIPEGGKVRKRKVTFCSALSSALLKAYFYAVDNGVRTVRIRTLNLSTSEYARMNDLVRFGLLYKEYGMKSGEYGVPKSRINRFIHNEWYVASHYYRNPITGENEMSDHRISFSQVPKVARVIEHFGSRLTSYKVESI